MSSNMAETQTDGNLSLLSGSSAEGQTYARHMADQNIQDIDILIHCGVVKYEENIIQTGVPGFVRIRLDNGVQPTGTTKFIGQNDSNGIHCLNGFDLKKKHCDENTEIGGPLPGVRLLDKTEIGGPLSFVSRSGTTEPDSSSAATTLTIKYETIDIGKQFHDALLKCEELRHQLNFDNIRHNYAQFSKGVCQSISDYALPLYQTSHNASVFQENNINQQMFRDLFTLIGPAYDYSIPQVTLTRIISVLDFYDKYASIGNPNNIKDMVDYFQCCAPTDVDLVPSLQLKFWPKDIKPFFERLKTSRPELHELIWNKTTMHVIPKWSTKTPKADQVLEFRYSFSAVELILAQNRSRNQKILNGVARSIYYKFLKGQKVADKSVIPSYFVKSTVLWMCETMDLDDDNPESLAKKWIEYAIDLLNKRSCPHYFISNLNILKPFPPESLDKAREILSQVNINQTYEIQMFSASKQELYRNKYNENTAKFLCRLKVSDIVNALNDYRQLKREWISLNSQLIFDDDEVDIEQTLTILNTFRAMDGDYDNWKKFRKIFIESKPRFDPIWGETVNSDNVNNFVEGLLSIGIILNFTNENILTMNSSAQQRNAINQEDFQNYLNVVHQYLDPQTLSSSYQSTYAYLYNQSVGAFERRRLTEHHPDGPTMTSNENKIKPKFSTFIIKACQNPDNHNLTLREVYQQQQLMIDVSTEDEQIAFAIQLSLQDQ